MPNQFDGFCYPTLIDAANANIAKGAINANAGIASPFSYTTINTTSVNMTYKYKPMSSAAEASYIHTRVYPLCSSVGQTNNNSGISVADALTASWLVIAIWASAYLFKSFRSGVRGY